MPRLSHVEFKNHIRVRSARLRPAAPPRPAPRAAAARALAASWRRAGAHVARAREQALELRVDRARGGAAALARRRLSAASIGGDGGDLVDGAAASAASAGAHVVDDLVGRRR